MMLKAEEVAYDQIRQARIFHFGTLSMTDEKVREATVQAITLAKEQGLLISFDPNFASLSGKVWMRQKFRLHMG